MPPYTGYHYDQQHTSYGERAAATTTTTATPTPAPPLQWPAQHHQHHPHPHHPSSSQNLLRRWWDAALSGGDRRRRQQQQCLNPISLLAAVVAPLAPPSRLLFFALAVAYKTPWTAVSSLLGQLAALYGPRVLLALNLAYFLPSIPVLLSHAAAAGGDGGEGGGGNDGSSFEARAGVPTAAALRLFLGLGGLAVVSLLIPPLCTPPLPVLETATAATATVTAATPPHHLVRLTLLLAATAALGALYGVAFGASYSLAARRCAPKGATVALSTGFVACGGVVLAADLLIKRGQADYDPQGLAALFRTVAGTCVVGLLASGLLLRRHWDELEADGGGRGGGEGAEGPAAGVSSSGKGGGLLLLLLPRSFSSPAALAAAARAAVRAALLLPPHSSVKPARVMLGCAPTGGSPRGFPGQPHAARPFAAGGAEAVALMASADGGSSRQRHHHRNNNRGTGSSGGGAALPVASAVVVSPAADHHASDGGAKGGGSTRIRALSPFSSSSSAALATARRIAPAALALSLSVGTSMLAFPFFTYTPAATLTTSSSTTTTTTTTIGRLGRSLPQALFYARLLGDVLGRLLTPRLNIAGPHSLLAWAVAKALLLLPLLLALVNPLLAGGDYGLCVAVALYWALSGAVNTAAYVVAPQMVPAPRRAQAGGLMAAFFQAACFGGLAMAGALQWLWPAPSSSSSGVGG